MNKGDIIAYIKQEATAEQVFPEFLTATSSVFICDIDPQPFKIDLIGMAWDTSRAQAVKVQRNTRHIGLVDPQPSDVNPVHNQEIILAPEVYRYLPRTMYWLESFARMQNAQLQRAMYVALQPHMHVIQHFDYGLYYLIRDRYHLVVQSEGSEMSWGPRTEIWKEGQLYWYNNKIRHHSYNSGDTGRIHLIFDLLPFRNVEYKDLINELLKEKD